MFLFFASHNQPTTLFFTSIHLLPRYFNFCVLPSIVVITINQELKCSFSSQITINQRLCSSFIAQVLQFLCFTSIVVSQVHIIATRSGRQRNGDLEVTTGVAEKPAECLAHAAGMSTRCRRHVYGIPPTFLTNVSEIGPTVRD